MSLGVVNVCVCECVSCKNKFNLIFAIKKLVCKCFAFAFYGMRVMQRAAAFFCFFPFLLLLLHQSSPLSNLHSNVSSSKFFSFATFLIEFDSVSIVFLFMFYLRNCDFHSFKRFTFSMLLCKCCGDRFC